MKQTLGFTLIELMITVAIVGIMAGIAYPSYQDSVRKSRRADAKAVLANLSNAMERRYTEGTYIDQANNTRRGYEGCAKPKETPLNIGEPWIYEIPTETKNYYNVTISAATASSYTLSAAPTGVQASDRCGTLTLTHTGAKGNSANFAQSECW
jgi:type IV pilus assembly protein PilE